jgi:hypothetical protein
MLSGQKLGPKTAYNGVFADPATFAKKVHLLWLGVGTVEPENMRAGIQRLHQSLLDANIQHVYYESPGTDHEWQTWRRDLKYFAPRLFQMKGKIETRPGIPESHSISYCRTYGLRLPHVTFTPCALGTSVRATGGSPTTDRNPVRDRCA